MDPDGHEAPADDGDETPAGNGDETPAGNGDEAPADTSPDSQMLTCNASKSPMFKSRDVLNMRISADFTKLNSAPTKEESGSQAVIELSDQSGAAPITANIIARGVSRFRCGFRPFSLKFEEKQKDNIFAHLGKSVKFVTHCGDREGLSPTLKADSIETYEQRLLMEDTVYQVLDQLQVPSLKTRLVRLTYHDAPTGKEETHLAFVREPEDEMAERCGMVEWEDLSGVDTSQFKVDQHGLVLLNLMNDFVIQYDGIEGKNLVTMADVDRKAIFYAPYDFDLVGVSRPDYVANEGRTLEQNRDAFADWLRRNQSPPLFDQIDRMLARADQMQRAVDQSTMNEENHEVFSGWLSLYLGLLRDFRTCEGHTDDPSRPLCHVEDDHGNRPDSASVVDPGEWSARIEPPGDVDMFAVDLQENTLYSLGGRVPLELFDAQQNLVASASDRTVSFKPSQTGTYYLRASLGEQMVSSPLLASPEEIDRYISLYTDDHGASLETATTLEAGTAAEGKWELAKGEDEDWFLLSAGASTNLHIVLRDTDTGRVEVSRRDAPADELPLEEYLLEGDNDVSWLFEQPGQYVVRVIQMLGLRANGSYTMTLQ
ncbi:MULTISPECIES: hypothetical protein [Sorangium]|uniref:Peptidase C-terminal archaeal/bacterial domain-containing protein n=1 Tax=Sorangium cellulosum TaxID=56 RepID=A0A4V0NH61_SORCE|nr:MULTISPECIES: hypothetical protein [Sorangium]AUX35552.1 uncharacterized protein SOCE836_077460 [Sorangium cellulosum]WCQ94852.1 hypothetical protein NQZ70_07623 [Sorangium sp. Soce836]